MFRPKSRAAAMGIMAALAVAVPAASAAAAPAVPAVGGLFFPGTTDTSTQCSGVGCSDRLCSSLGTQQQFASFLGEDTLSALLTPTMGYMGCAAPSQ